jgi:hypothetical protein
LPAVTDSSETGLSSGNQDRLSTSLFSLLSVHAIPETDDARVLITEQERARFSD